MSRLEAWIDSEVKRQHICRCDWHLCVSELAAYREAKARTGYAAWLHLADVVDEAEGMGMGDQILDLMRAREDQRMEEQLAAWAKDVQDLEFPADTEAALLAALEEIGKD